LWKSVSEVAADAGAGSWLEHPGPEQGAGGVVSPARKSVVGAMVDVAEASSAMRASRRRASDHRSGSDSPGWRQPALAGGAMRRRWNRSRAAPVRHHPHRSQPISAIASLADALRARQQIVESDRWKDGAGGEAAADLSIQNRIHGRRGAWQG
jgi:hypothetical protein